MAHSALVKVLDATDELPVELGGLCLSQASISDDEVKELATVSMLHYHKKLFLGLDDLPGGTAKQSRSAFGVMD